MYGSRVDRQSEVEQVDHENTLMFVEWVLWQVQLYGKGERGGGRPKEMGKTKIVDK